jgi:hypothetical protein
MPAESRRDFPSVTGCRVGTNGALADLEETTWLPSCLGGRSRGAVLVSDAALVGAPGYHGVRPHPYHARRCRCRRSELLGDDGDHATSNPASQAHLLSPARRELWFGSCLHPDVRMPWQTRLSSVHTLRRLPANAFRVSMFSSSVYCFFHRFLLALP